MQTRLPATFLATDEGRQANSILRSCVHCGFCTATCPTFLLTGNELDSPRGRIYLIKEALEGNPVSATTRSHLDRCLTCQSCETTCPSDVRYHDLLNIGRRYVETRTRRPVPGRLQQWLIGAVLTRKKLLAALLNCARLIRPVLPETLKRKLPRDAAKDRPWSGRQGTRRMVLLDGCVQGSLSPDTNAAVARVLSCFDIQAEPLSAEGCCGALHYHMNSQAKGLDHARKLIDGLCTSLDRGAEAVISSASGCGNFIKDYAGLFTHDPAYAAKAARVVEHTRDIVEILAAEDLSRLQLKQHRRLVFHCPCSLQHGQQQNGRVEEVLRQLDFTLVSASDSHLCCGSAGAYSILQPALSRQLLERKILALEKESPEAIATANIGCQMHLSGATSKKVRHWIEFVAEALE